MDLTQAIKILNSTLKKQQPKKFSGTWVYRHAPKAYRYIWKNVRTELGDIDWDAVTRKLDRDFQQRWLNRRSKKVKPYRNIQEVKKVLKPFGNKLYVFIQPGDDNDRLLRDTISVALVRIAQKGNIKAQQKLVELLHFTVEFWVEVSPRLRKWKHYSCDIDDKIRSCIRCYKFTGTFLGYLFRTLEYSAWGLRPLEAYSLDDKISFDGEKRRIDSVVQDAETGEIRIYSRT